MPKAKRSKSKVLASFMGLIKPVKSIKDKYDATLTEVGASVQKVIASEARALFKVIPELESISWRQLTPSFNDGDPCIFEVHSPSFTFNVDVMIDGEINKSGQEADIYSSELDLATAEDPSKRRDLDGQLILDFMHNFEQLPDDLMEVAFGDGYQITVTRDGIELTEYYE